ncbi:Calx-beta domain-containing protein [Fimbriiglobus ruber]|uniref:Mobile element protein n=1 Tax=Fimbriiglobus ruber TaxID=1908690 RepID=A0A225DLH0_9BACT|nr:Calx-beta domain-containing protein [Fimbriiglobus ruber]OWK41823.1 Mobile element protein [Fimbriiglobus ruber]
MYDTDYTAPASYGGSVTFTAADTTTEVAVDPEYAAEGTKTVVESLTATGTYTVSGGAATVSIVEVPLETVWITAIENAVVYSPTGPSDGYFVVSRSSDADDLTVTYSEPTGTAVAGTNYWTPSAAGGSIEFTPGESSAVITVDPRDDGVTDTPKTVIESLSGAYLSVSGGPATVTITETAVGTDDVWITADEDAVEFGPSGTTDGSFTIHLTSVGGSESPLVVNYEAPLGSATYDVDYSSPSPYGGDAVTFTPGVTSITLPVIPIDNGTVHDPLTVVESLIGGGRYYSIADGPTATVTITQEPADVWVTADADAVKFGPAGPADGSFTFHRSYTSGALAVAYGPPTGTAVQGTNYSSPLGGTQTVTFADGQATVTVALTPIDDGRADGNQTVVEAIDSGLRYTADPAASSATGTILEEPTTAWITADEDAVKFGPAGPSDGYFTVHRSDGSGTIAVAYGPPTGSAAVGVNYWSPGGGTQTVTFTRA